MASVFGLLEAREKRGREEITRLRVQAALGEAELELQRLVDARVAVTGVPAGPPLVVMGSTESAVARSTAPRRESGVVARTLAQDYQRILSVLESEAAQEGMGCQQLAVALGQQAVLAKTGWCR
ncbi:hypothetical protein [Streptomyces sp. NBC_00576]|uniref:hypothetical protein n=1 Tax=Streptomyces sp. NBC_00576 TaxID=2903665 RepID=UPI002E81BF59|nr:hypothetical protein [Streptomyces sp. NBC_00576]WUB68782.1 hypothetical protein OG734_00980 [Streptomyces sp. NBC_00576]